jgi:DNA-binding protein HU-beta
MFGDKKYFWIKNETLKNIDNYIKTGIEKVTVQATVEAFMEAVKNSMINGDNVYLRGFGSFVIKKRAQKTGRNISKNTTIIIPAHNIPAFKPAKSFVNAVKTNTKVK